MGHRFVDISISAGTGNLHSTLLGDRIRHSPSVLMQDVPQEVAFYVNKHLIRDEIVARLGATAVADYRRVYKHGVTALTVVQIMDDGTHGEKVGTILVEVI